MNSLYASLIAYWNFQEAAGASRVNVAGAAANLSGAGVTAVDGFIGSASGYSGGVISTTSSTAALQGGPKDYTFAGWIKISSFSASAYGILSKASGVAGHKEYLLRYTGTGTDRFTFSVYRATDSANTATANTFGAVSSHSGEWIFIAAWNDNTGLTVNIEVNGGATDSTSLGGATQAASTDPLAFAADDGGGTNPLTGTIAEWGKWDRVLTRQERLYLYNNGRGRTFPFVGGRSLTNTRHKKSRRMAGIL